MVSVCLYFKVHHAHLLANDNAAEQSQIDRAATLCYLPTNELLLRMIEESNGQFKVSFSISGTAIELLQQYRPDVIESFRRLTDTGSVEILGETYYHSLSSLHSQGEWKRQVKMHSELIKELFGLTPSVYRNTELIHHNNLVAPIAEMNFRGILCEGVEKILKGRNANRLYQSPNANIGLLLRNARLSDDIAFRFDDDTWSEQPLTAEKFAEWLHTHPEGTEVINLFMDYETFGVHKHPSTGIFDFLQALPGEVLKHPDFRFATPTQALDTYKPSDTYDVTRTISWEDRGDAACVWSENMMQHNTLRKIYSLENTVKTMNCEKTTATWGRLQSADHFYYMTSDNEKYRNPYSSGKEAFEQYNSAIRDFEIALIQKNLDHAKKTPRKFHAALSFF